MLPPSIDLLGKIIGTVKSVVALPVRPLLSVLPCRCERESCQSPSDSCPDSVHASRTAGHGPERGCAAAWAATVDRVAVAALLAGQFQEHTLHHGGGVACRRLCREARGCLGRRPRAHTVRNTPAGPPPCDDVRCRQPWPPAGTCAPAACACCPARKHQHCRKPALSKSRGLHACIPCMIGPTLHAAAGLLCLMASGGIAPCIDDATCTTACVWRIPVAHGARLGLPLRAAPPERCGAEQVGGRAAGDSGRRAGHRRAAPREPGRGGRRRRYACCGGCGGRADDPGRPARPARAAAGLPDRPRVQRTCAVGARAPRSRTHGDRRPHHPQPHAAQRRRSRGAECMAVCRMRVAVPRPACCA